MISLESLFVSLLGLQFFVIVGHDWIMILGWNDARQVQAVIGRRKLAWATLINAIFPALALVAAIRFFHSPKPAFVRFYWLSYASITVGSAIAMWWLPYFFKSSAGAQKQYHRMYAVTRHLLSARHGNSGPNAVHLGFHLLFLATFVCAFLLWFQFY